MPPHKHSQRSKMNAQKIVLETKVLLGIPPPDQEDFHYLIVDIFALGGSARLQDVVVVTMVND